MFGHPPTPQSYQSASSPYQNQENSTFSPNFQNFQQQVKVERLSPSTNHFQNNYPNFNEQQFFPIPSMDSANQHQNYNADYPVHKTPISNNSYRYHPYQSQLSPYERPQAQSQVSSSSPAYPPQPTPSPSPKTCDKCGYVCDSASQLIDHLNIAHPPTPAPHLSSFQPNQHFMFGNEQQITTQIKLEDDAQSEILDLDSHKVHQVFPEDEKRQNGDPNSHNPHSVTALIGNWPSQQSHQQKMFQQDQRLFMNNPDQKIFNPNVPSNIPEQKMFSSHTMPNQEFIGNGVTTTTQDSVGHSPTPSYRPFEHLPSQPNTPVISSTQVPNTPAQTAPPSTKSASWKSNEARRPKTYNCTACNKWFTSSGHLKRHYNTTLHKNAVKSSGQPDPAALPISAHHHPARDNSSREERSSNSPEDSREDGNSLPPQFERPSPMPGLLQQPPNGPYDRQPAPNIHQPPPLHSPMAHNSPLGNPMVSLNNLAPSNGSPPNGEAGPSTVNLDSRGLLSLSANPNTTPGFNMAPPMMPMESNQFQMYPNESAPHVTQDMATSSLNTTGELQFITDNSITEAQPLPSFAQFQAHRVSVLVSYNNANVGGGGSVTAPYTYFPDNPFENVEPRILFKASDFENEYKLTILTPSEHMHYENNETILPYPPSPASQYSPSQDFHNNNISDEDNKMQIHMMGDIKLRLDAQPDSPEKAHTKRDYEETTGSPHITSTMQPKLADVHKCFDCDKVFNKACYLTQHNKTFHSGDKPYKCTRCGKRFSSEMTYQEHSAKHAGEKPHKCELCPKQFNHKTDLRRHMCLHTGQKPYACDTCGKGFIRKDHMLKHCETHTRKAQIKASAGLR
ncbi:hypothetical protein HHI36_005489 [Cryptolaemus montrouzieri]|uniref:C2H2-type domain-containing protein n=1 Tax=Cryptolaemus montrouzieri TaxID=559131 RepID=A0ABD2NUI6_9CUCU